LPGPAPVRDGLAGHLRLLSSNARSVPLATADRGSSAAHRSARYVIRLNLANFRGRLIASLTPAACLPVALSRARNSLAARTAKAA
jgi:hypothetical protein